MLSSEGEAAPRAGRLRLPITRLPRVRVPQGLPEALGAAIVALMAVGSRERFADDRAGFVLELLMILCAGAVGVWPVQAALAATVAMTTLLALPLELKRPTLIVMTLVVGSLVARGLRPLAAGIAAWWLLVQFLFETTPMRPWPLVLANMLFWVVAGAIAWAFGEAVHRLQAERARSLVDRTAAMQAQRRAIARDLHDTIAYSTTSIILRAEQAKLRGVPDPQLAADLDYIINAGRSAMRDLRGMMETLRRNEPDADQPQAPWQLSSLDDVLTARTAELREHGFTVTSHVDADLADLPESVREALAKVVVEATANMLRHGDPGGPVSIMFESGEGEFEAVFINRSKPPGSTRPDTPQLGLIGARERIEALGGELEVTSTSPTWVVRARIPLEV
nr:hypothetical protein [Propionibacterium sp.]